MGAWDNILKTQAVPENQLAALPLIGAQQYISPDGADTVVFGNSINKYWSPLALGIVGRQPELDVGTGSGIKHQITSNWIDVTPCVFFCIGIARNVPAGGVIAARSFSLCAQYKLGPLDSPPTSIGFDAVPPTSLSEVFAGIISLTSTALTFPAVNGAYGAVTQRSVTLVSPNSQPGTTAPNVPLLMGPAVRFQINLQTNPRTENSSTYSMHLWGQS